MKYNGSGSNSAVGESLPTRGAWIEIAKAAKRQYLFRSLPTRGAWIEIADFDGPRPVLSGRSPHGERGLKLVATMVPRLPSAVAPHTGSVD